MRKARRARLALLTAAITVGGLLATTIGPAEASGSSWRLSLKLHKNSSAFSVVTAGSATNAWVFGAPGVYHLHGSAWTKITAPSELATVVAATSLSATDVWAFASSGAILRYTNGAWSVTKKLGATLAGGLAISDGDVWAFGASDKSTWHYNGATWVKVPSGLDFLGGSASSGGNVWAYAGKTVARWTGSAWAKTSLASLLPKDTPVSQAFIEGVYVATAKNVWAVASSGGESDNGYLVVLHYTGKWRKVARSKGDDAPWGMAPDGSGGLWIPVNFGLPARGSMDHFSHGKLSQVGLPYSTPHVALYRVAAAPGSRTAFVVGLYRKSTTNYLGTPIVLRYGP